MGDQYPAAKVLGVDLSPIQPEWVPPNVQFVVDDVESPWSRPADHFDYIHARHTVMAIKNWPKLMDQVFEYVLIPLKAFYWNEKLMCVDILNQEAGSSCKKSTTILIATTAPCRPTTKSPSSGETSSRPSRVLV